MPIQNRDVVNIFEELADLLELDNANPFKVRAYRNAARTVGNFPDDITDMVANDKDFTQYSGIGKEIAAKIKEIVETGKLEKLEKQKKSVSSELAEIMKIGGLGPKRTRALHNELDIDSIADLKQAVKEKKIRKLEGFGKKAEENISEELKRYENSRGRFLWRDAEEIAAPLLDCLENCNAIKHLELAGSYRRRRETVGDLDIIAIADEAGKVMTLFTGYEDVEKVISKGDTKSSVILRNGLQVDLRVMGKGAFGAAMVYFTGSKAHNIALRKLANDKDCKLNEYGIFDKDKKRLTGKTEKSVYDELGLQFIRPELREDRGEIDAAKEDHLPDLIQLEDIRGDLQSHTKASDGKNTLKEMAEAAKQRGYDYLAITDHSQNVRVANGLDPKRTEKHLDEIDKVNSELKGITLLKSMEVDILEDGSLDLPDEILKKLDMTMAAVHSMFNLSKKKQTDRIIRALHNQYVKLLAHPSGRIIGQRAPYDMDMKKIFRTAKECNCFPEINAHPERLDLNDIYAKYAKEIGLKIAINTDAHSVNELDNMRCGIFQARRGWIEKQDVINTRTLKDLRKLLKK